MQVSEQTKRSWRFGVGTLLVCLFALAGCTGEILDAENGAQDAGTDAPDMTDFDPIEPDFGEVTMTPEECEKLGTLAGEAPMRLLTRYEYDNTIADLLGDVSRPAAEEFPGENLANGFENNAYIHAVSPISVRKFLEVAETVAASAVADRRDTLLPCDPTGQERACGLLFVEDFMTRAFRRPLLTPELEGFNGLFNDSYDLWGLDVAMEQVIAAALQSPQFLYRIEYTDDGVAGDLVEVGPYEMASRLSYFLWATMPDDELFLAAESNALGTVEEVEAQAQRMLASDRAKTIRHQFYRQWLALDRLDSATKDQAAFPGFQGRGQAWKESTYGFLDHIYSVEPTLAALYTSSSLFLTSDLAVLYGFPAKPGVSEYPVDERERAGLLTQPALMATLALADQASPIQRGVFVREKILCQHLQAPPPDLVVVPPDPDPNATTREVFAQHTETQICADCHVKIDPIGFGFEAYNGAGQYRLVENALPVDTSGTVVDVPDADLEGDFGTAKELATKIGNSWMAEECFSDTWFRFALGRGYGDDDACSAFDVMADFSSSGGDLNDLFVSIVRADSFRYRKIQATEDAP